MTYGWKVFDAASGEISVNKTLLRFTYYARVSADGSTAVSGLVAASAVAFSTLYTGNFSPILVITVTDGNVAWSRSSWADGAQFDLYVLQWK